MDMLLIVTAHLSRTARAWTNSLPAVPPSGECLAGHFRER
jgi:hypothetical protein